MANKDRISEELIEMVNINSENPPGDETKIVEYLKKKFDKIGLKYYLYESEEKRISIIAETKPNQGLKTIHFSCHTDTVPISEAIFPAKKDGDIVYGRGTTDDKGPLASCLELARKVMKEDLNINVMISCFADEENGSLKGMVAFLKEYSKYNFKPDFSVIAEANSFNIDIGEKGAVKFKGYCKGKEAHCSQPHVGINAISMMSKFILELEDYQFPNCYSKEYNTSSIITIGVINGGVKQTIIPGKCEIDVDIRIVPNQTKEDIEKGLNDLIKKMRLQDEKFNFQYEIYRIEKPHAMNQNDSSISILEKALTDNNINAKRTFQSGMSISKKLNQAGFKAVICGPGEITQCHTKDENVNLNDLVKGVNVYYSIVKGFESLWSK